MNRDFAEMLSALSAAGAEFLIVGAHALAAHGTPRATGDIDIWVKATADNAARVLQALQAFGAPRGDLTADDLIQPDTVFQIGVVPSRVDILSGISGVRFEEPQGSTGPGAARQSRAGPMRFRTFCEPLEPLEPS